MDFQNILGVWEIQEDGVWGRKIAFLCLCPTPQDSWRLSSPSVNWKGDLEAGSREFLE